MKQIIGKLSYSNVIASIALFLALGGSAYAAQQSSPKSPKLPASTPAGWNRVLNNAIGPEDLEMEAVGTKQIEEKSVTPEKVNPATWNRIKNVTDQQIEGSITMQSLAPELKQTVTELKKSTSELKKTIRTAGATGPAGPTGPEGKQGPQGNPGQPGSASALSAFVSSSGNLIRSSGAISAKADETGVYEVFFGRDVTTCALVATVASPTTTDGSKGESPAFGQTGVSGLTGNADGIVVSIAEGHGAPANRAFFVTAEC